ncbi:MAG TPA: FtsQ-type POTRA domain-containing protein [Blastocatellia bacterium]|nr:FtsQ-type POTRA domain-containing protein [Blastocatellia bacterium]
MARGEGRPRGQVVTPRSSRRVTRPRSRSSFFATIGGAVRTVAAFAKPIAILLVIAAAIIGYNVLAGSRLFALRSVEVSNAGPALAAEIKDVVRRTVGDTRMLDVDLGALRGRIEALPRVRAASVARMLPDQIHVQVAERRPALLARRASQALVWLDEESVELGDVSELKRDDDREIPPIVRGFVEGDRSPAAVAENRDRVAIYRQIEREFKEGPNPIWNLVDELDLAFTTSVNLRLVNSVVNVLVGNKDFRNRFETGLQFLAAARQGDVEKLQRFRAHDPEEVIRRVADLSFLDVSRPDRIVYNFGGTGKTKTQEKKK